jgi:hypothetical protein
VSAFRLQAEAAARGHSAQLRPRALAFQAKATVRGYVRRSSLKYPGVSKRAAGSARSWRVR